MKHWYSGIDLWYGTTDAPAPTTTARALVVVPVTVGVSPIHAGNVVTIRFAVDGGPEQAVAARLIETDLAANTQYFEALLPRLDVGKTVRYVAVCDYDGRRSPDRATIGRLPTSFTVTADAPVIAQRGPWSPGIVAPPLDLARGRAQRFALAFGEHLSYKNVETRRAAMSRRIIRRLI